MCEDGGVKDVFVVQREEDGQTWIPPSSACIRKNAQTHLLALETADALEQAVLHVDGRIRHPARGALHPAA